MVINPLLEGMILQVGAHLELVTETHLVATGPVAPVACNFRARPARSARSRCTCQLEREDAMDEGLSHYLCLATPSNRSIYPCFAYIAGKCR